MIKYWMFLIFICFYLQAQVPKSDVWVANGTVFTINSDSNYTYIGGNFNYIGPNLGYGVKVSTYHSKPDMDFLKVNGQIRSMEADGSGGWY
jgi:hypothetical protein